MPVQILDELGPLAETELAAAEQTLRVQLPPDYRNFLLKHNGGRPKPDRFNIDWRPEQKAAAVGPWSMLSWFFSVHAGRSCNLLRSNTVSFAGRLPADTLAIGEDPGGDLLLIRTAGPQRGALLFWVMEMEAQDGETPTEDNVGFVADSFDDFLANRLYAG